MSKPSNYAVLLRPLSEADGGGYLGMVPDLPGCMSDGDTPEAAFTNVQDAIACWIEAATEAGRSVPEPTTNQGELLKKVG